MKRHAATGTEPDAKRPKDDTVDGMLTSVTAALESRVAELETSQEMLLAMARGCLATPVDERHKYQTAVADMLREVFMDMEEKTKSGIDDAVAECGRITARRSSLCNARGIAEEQLSARVAALNAAKTAFCNDNVALQNARKFLAKALETQAREGASVREASTNKDALEVALRDHYPSLECDSCADLAAHVDAIVSASKKVQHEESLVQAFSVAAKKLPSTRSLFDGAVLKQLQGELIRNAAILEKVVAAGEPAMTSLAEVVAESERAFQVARHCQTKSAAALRAFDIDQRVGGAHVWDARDAERSVDQELLIAEAEQMTAEGRLEDFRSGPREALETLLTRKNKPAEIPCVKIADPDEKAASPVCVKIAGA